MTLWPPKLDACMGTASVRVRPSPALLERMRDQACKYGAKIETEFVTKLELALYYEAVGGWMLNPSVPTCWLARAWVTTARFSWRMP